MAKIKYTSFQNTSILRKFTIFFVLMSMAPVGVLWYLYYQIKKNGKIEVGEMSFDLTLILIILGVLIGYGVMRSILKCIIQITEINKENLEEFLGPGRSHELSEENNEIKFLTKYFGEMTKRLEENIKNLNLYKKTLHSVLSRAGRGISSLQNIDSFFELIVETVAEALGAKIGGLMLLDEEKGGFYVKTVYGTDFNDKDHALIKIDDEPFKTILSSSKPFLISDLGELPPIKEELKGLFQPPVLCAPLDWKGKKLGIIFVSGKKNTSKNFKKEEEISLLSNLAMQTAIAIENSRLSFDAEKTYLETISALALAVEAKDRYSSGHLERVADYAIRIARKFDLSEEDIKILRDGARLHDLGKIGILDDILKKPTSLTEQEWEMMKKHTEIGEGIIKPIRSLAKLGDVIRHHHEKYDGSGYPDGLKGEDISLLARILCVADIFDALTTDRPYRKAYTVEEAKQELLKMKEKLDPKVVNAFLGTL